MKTLGAVKYPISGRILFFWTFLGLFNSYSEKHLIHKFFANSLKMNHRIDEKKKEMMSFEEKKTLSLR